MIAGFILTVAVGILAGYFVGKSKAESALKQSMLLAAASNRPLEFTDDEWTITVNVTSVKKEASK